MAEEVRIIKVKTMDGVEFNVMHNCNTLHENARVMVSIVSLFKESEYWSCTVINYAFKCLPEYHSDVVIKTSRISSMEIKQEVETKQI